MGIVLTVLKFFFVTDPKKKIVESKKRIENFKSIQKTIKSNVKNQTESHYHKTAKENIKTLDYQIQKEKERIAFYKKKL